MRDQGMVADTWQRGGPSSRGPAVWLATLVAVASLAFATCASPERRVSGTPLDPKLSRFTYIEEGNLVALIVSTRATRYRLTRPYIPVEVAVVNKGLDSLTLTRESFTLIDAAGSRYPVVGRDELSRGYGNTDVDRRLSDAIRLLQLKFSAYEPVPANLTPGFDRGIARDRVHLPRFSYMVDFIYFPRPKGNLVEGPLELHVRAPELPDPVFVRFSVGAD